MRWIAAICLLCGAGLAWAGENLVPDPDFRHGLEHWKVRFPEPNETKYANNHQWVSVAAAPGGGKALKMVSKGSVAASEGVKAVTPMIEIDPEGSYEFGAETWSSGTAVKIFIEGYQKDPERTEAGADAYPGYVRVYRKTMHVKTPPKKWGKSLQELHFAQRHKRYRPDALLIKLYCYWPAGEVYFRDVTLRPIPPKEKQK